MIIPRPISVPTRAYHDGMLLVKMRATADSRGLAGRETALFASRGLTALATLERAGMIRKIVPLMVDDRRVPAPPRPAVGRMLASTSFAASPEDPRSGVSLVELERDADVPDVQVELASDPNVEQVSRVPIRYLLAKKRARRRTVAATPPVASTMWNLRKIQWEEARAIPGYTEPSDIKVAVLDTGIQSDHPDLAGRVARYEFSHPTSSSDSSDLDVIGHGTHVAGTIAAAINNDVGINGVCECPLYIWKIFDDQPDYDPDEDEFVYYVEPVMYLRALEQCLEEGVKVINLSIGGPGEPDFVEQQLFDRLIAAGTIVVAAMGNEADAVPPSGIVSYPAAIPGVIAVGATGPGDRRASFSNYRGSHIALCAPGEAIWSTLPTYSGQFGFRARRGPGGQPVPGTPFRRDTDYDAWDGTSMASPHVAAAAALLVANAGDMGGADARSALQRTADRVPAMCGRSSHREYGSGRLNLFRLISETG